MLDWLRNAIAPKAPSEGRSPKWPAFEKAFLKDFPSCNVCGTITGCVGHHVVPFHIDPSRELDRTNLWTLCPPHHLLFGHLMSWESVNVNVRGDSALWKTKIATRP